MRRDEYGFVCQSSKEDPTYMDGGDTSRATGILALVGSEKDQKLLPLHVIWSGYFVRHPGQIPWNSPQNFSRDQMICLIAGMWRTKQHGFVRKFFFERLKYWLRCQNTHENNGLQKKEGADILWNPSVIWHMILCGRIWWLYWFAPLGYLFQVCDILWNCYVTPQGEQNQIFCIVVVSGLLPLYLKLHPDFDASMNKYWSEWRDQKEIADMIIKFAKGNL